MRRLQRVKSVLKQAGMAIYKHVHPIDREFWQVYPTINSIEGFLVSPVQERWLFRTAKSLPDKAIIVEIGSFKGRSTCSLAYGCRGTNKHVFAIDTFEGNDIDFTYRGFFEEFLYNIERCGLSAYVTPIQERSSQVAKSWDNPVHMLFIDGSHQYQDVLTDFYDFFPHLVPGCIVAVHDVVETWPGTSKAWHKHIKHHLRNIGYCSTLAYGFKKHVANN